ncbi:hypothetical protein V3C99_002001 [Haemonchus contortus]
MENLPNLEDISSDDEDDRIEEIPALEDISSDEGDNRVVDRHDSPEDRTNLNRLQETYEKWRRSSRSFRSECSAIPRI